MQSTIISESLGDNRSVELNEDTGELVILDEKSGVTLSALQVLALTGFLSTHDKVLFRAMWHHIEEQEAQS